MRPSDQEEIETLRRNLILEMAQLNQLRMAAGVEAMTLISVTQAPVEQLDWDADEEENTEEAPTNVPASEATDVETLTPIECQPIVLPSYGNTNSNHAKAEIRARIAQAFKQLSNLRELIVTKSFQYSDVIRPAPRKTVITRSRKLIQDLNEQITYHSQVYMECRSRLQKLQAGPDIMRHFQVLKKEDVRSSTAILNPNIPGSTTLRLSWIWESVTQRLEPGHFDNSANCADPNCTADPNVQAASDRNPDVQSVVDDPTSSAVPTGDLNVGAQAVRAAVEEKITQITDKPSLVECESIRSIT